MAKIVVLGATGDVGQGIVRALIERDHAVIAVARTAARLAALAKDLGQPANFRAIAGSLESDAAAEAIRRSACEIFPKIDGVVVSVNAPRHAAPILSLSAAELAVALASDLITHHAVARTFLPLLAPGGILLGIGGGSADIILEGGTHLSMAQAGLRMFYRGLAHETEAQPVAIRQLIIASVVNGATTRHLADPLWVTDREVGEQVAAMIERPQAFAEPIWRIARRDETGKPVVSPERPTRTQRLPT